MSKTTQVIIWVVVAVIVVGGGIWWWVASRAPSINPGGPMIPASSTDQSNAGGNSGTAMVSTGTSDGDLDQDMANINMQMNGLASDSADVNASVASSSGN